MLILLRRECARAIMRDQLNRIEELDNELASYKVRERRERDARKERGRQRKREREGRGEERERQRHT